MRVRMPRRREPPEPCPPHKWGLPSEEWQAWHPNEYVLICAKCMDRWPNLVAEERR